MYVNIELWCETSHVTWEHFDSFGWWGPSSVSTNLSCFVGRFVQSIVCSFPSLTGRNRNSVWGRGFCFPVLLGGSFPILGLVLTHTDWTSLCCECWRGDCSHLYSFLLQIPREHSLPGLLGLPAPLLWLRGGPTDSACFPLPAL